MAPQTAPSGKHTVKGNIGGIAVGPNQSYAQTTSSRVRAFTST